MKIFNLKLFSIFLIVILVVLSNFGFGQITIDESDMPVPGDTVRISTALNIDFYDFEETGENFIWDYPELIALSQRVDTFVAVTETPFFYWPFFLFRANLASPFISDSPFPEIPLTDVYNFYNNSTDNFKDLGFAATLFSLPLPFKFDNPDIVYEFPMNYGNVDSSESGLSLGLENIGYVMIDRKRTNTVDGWGQLITPYGTLDVLRLKSEVYEYDSIYIDSVSFGFPLEREFVEYKWLAKDQKIPLLKVSSNLLNLVVEYVDSLRVEMTGIANKPINEAKNISVYPNPVSEILIINIEEGKSEKVKLSLYDLQGKTVFQKFKIPGSNNQIELDFTELNLNPGMYLLIVSAGKIKTSYKLIFKPKN